MLLKAALRERGVDLFDRSEGRVGRSIGFEKCVRLAREHVGLTEDELGTLRAVDSLRDDEQHWIATVNEGLLYLHARACVTLFDEILLDVFGERLADHLPERVLPLSTRPPADLDVLIGEQFQQAKQLLRPGQRRRAEARAMLRGLLALEAHASQDAVVNEHDVNRVERGIKDGKALEQIFPRLGTLGAAIGGEGPTLTVHFTKKVGVPVTYIPADDPREAAAVRQVDLQRKYYMSPHELANRVGLTPPRALALRRELKIDEDENCLHEFVFGTQRHKRYSDNALREMQRALETIDMDDVWKRHRPRRRQTGS
jgi:hypothetical protein